MQAAFFIFSQLGATYPAKAKGIAWIFFKENEQCHVSSKIYIDNDFHYLLI